MIRMSRRVASPSSAIRWCAAGAISKPTTATIINNADTYTGPTTLESGTLSVGNPTGLGTGALNLLNGGFGVRLEALGFGLLSLRLRGHPASLGGGFRILGRLSFVRVGFSLRRFLGTSHTSRLLDLYIL